jgi:hypothetical protein
LQQNKELLCSDSEQGQRSEELGDTQALFICYSDNGEAAEGCKIRTYRHPICYFVLRQKCLGKERDGLEPTEGKIDARYFPIMPVQLLVWAE